MVWMGQNLEHGTQIPILIIEQQSKKHTTMIKKFLFLSIIAGLVLAGCNPNEELYNELDKKTSDAYTDQFSYTLADEDYSAITDLALEDATTEEDSNMIENIEEYKAFADEFPAADYIPKFLGDKYIALDQGSSINVTYKYMGSMGILDKFGEAESYTLTEADYDSMGEGSYEPGQYDNFSSSVPPEDYLPDFLTGQYPDAGEGEMVAVTYDYYQGYVVTLTDYYQKKGQSWEVVPNVYVLSSDDYDSMGAPGNYDNFSSDVPPEDYLPTFLKQKFPYAEAGDQKYVVFKYYSGYVSVRAMKYSYDGSSWHAYETVSNQFINNGEKWVFDPTVRFTMSSSDYQLIVDERDSKYVDSYGTAEYYSGASAYYNNFNLRIPDRMEYDSTTFHRSAIAESLGESTETLTDEEYTSEAKEIMWNRIINLADEPMNTRGAFIVLLQNKFPNAQPQKNGVDVYYKVTFDTYNNDRSSSQYTVTYLCTASGNPAEFEYVDGNTPYSE